MKRGAILALTLLLAVAGCGRRHETQAPALTFEELTDTTGLAQGEPILTGVEPQRMPNGALRVRGEVELPDGVRIQVSIYRKGTQQMLNRLQVVVADGRFDSPPILGDGKPLPPGDYRFEYLALFNDAWQTPEVLRRTRSGQALRGPGITRDRVGGAAFYLVEERSL